MNLLPVDSFRLLHLVVSSSPYTCKIPDKFLGSEALRQAKRRLLAKGYIYLTGEKSQWERMFPTETGKLFYEWQLPDYQAKQNAEKQALRLATYLLPKDDGKTHINVYSGGATALGRLLSHFSRCKLPLPEGVFSSVEAYWYYLLVDALGVRDAIGRAALMKSYGVEAKKRGRALMGDFHAGHAFATGHLTEEQFHAKIAEANILKVGLDPDLQELLRNSILPFEHYYVFKGKVVEPQEHKWILGVLSRIRQVYKIMPSVHNLYKCPGWEDDPECVYVGRKGKGQDGYFGNPFPKNPEVPGEASAKFRVWAEERGRTDREYRERVKGLAGKKLMCFCGNLNCHAYVLADLCVQWNEED